MARIAGVDLPPNKRIEIALTYIYGIGRSQAGKILTSAGINFDIKVRELNDEEINKIRKTIEEQYRVEGDLRKEVTMNIKRLMEIGSYRGLRHRRGLPVRGSAPRPTVAHARARAAAQWPSRKSLPQRHSR